MTAVDVALLTAMAVAPPNGSALVSRVDTLMALKPGARDAIELGFRVVAPSGVLAGARSAGAGVRSLHIDGRWDQTVGDLRRDHSIAGVHGL